MYKCSMCGACDIGKYVRVYTFNPTMEAKVYCLICRDRVRSAIQEEVKSAPEVIDV